MYYIVSFQLTESAGTLLSYIQLSDAEQRD